MTQKIALTKELLLANRTRWNAVAQLQANELVGLTHEQRWQKLNSMLQLAISLGLYEKMKNSDVSDVRTRWLRLKANYA